MAGMRSIAVPIQSFDPSMLEGADVIADALFGTGLDRPLDERLCAIVDRINSTGSPGAVDRCAERPARRYRPHPGTLHSSDAHHFLHWAEDRLVSRCGSRCHAERSSSMPWKSRRRRRLAAPTAERLDRDFISRVLPRRRRTAHKGDFGHVLIVAGGSGMPGAARLCGEACLRAGAGLVTVATRAANVTAVMSGRPELMCHAVEDLPSLQPLIERADLIVAGPGLGRDTWARAIFDSVHNAERPLVLDADALNLLATTPRPRDDWILTPHPGEAARLLGLEAQADPGGSPRGAGAIAHALRRRDRSQGCRHAHRHERPRASALQSRQSWHGHPGHGRRARPVLSVPCSRNFAIHGLRRVQPCSRTRWQAMRLRRAGSVE